VYAVEHGEKVVKVKKQAIAEHYSK